MHICVCASEHVLVCFANSLYTDEIFHSEKYYKSSQKKERYRDTKNTCILISRHELLSN